MAVSYQPGECNIGRDEIARRRRTGHVGLALTLGGFVVLLGAGAPPIARIGLAVPAAVAASGYLQARLKFCAGFGSQGVFNFGSLGRIEHVVDEEARRRDRAKATQIGLASLAVGVGVGVAAVVLPA